MKVKNKDIYTYTVEQGFKKKKQFSVEFFTNVLK